MRYCFVRCIKRIMYITLFVGLFEINFEEDIHIYMYIGLKIRVLVQLRI